MSVALEAGFWRPRTPRRLGEVLGQHADRLRLRLGLDGLRRSPWPIPGAASSWSCRGRRSARRPARAPATARRRAALSGAHSRLQTAPALAPRRRRARARCRAARLARPWPMMRGSRAHAPMSQPASPTRVNRKAVLLRAVPRRRSDAIARMAPAPAQTPSTAATIGCGQARMAFTRSPVMRVNISRLGLLQA